MSALRDGLDKLGWQDAKNLAITIKTGSRDPDTASRIATELLNENPEVILATNVINVAALRRVAGSIPIVFVQVNDPVALGFVASMANPGGTVTGFIGPQPSIAAKWLDWLKQIVPGVQEVGVLIQPENPANNAYMPVLRENAPRLGVNLVELPMLDDSQTDRELSAFAAKLDRGVIVITSPYSGFHRQQIVAGIERAALPAIYWDRSFALAGGLASYGLDVVDQYRQAARYVDRILKGAKPASLPVQAPNKFELVVNLKTAKTLGISLSPLLLTNADEVIE
jgi:putative ABC transport system substrate-binding protein